MFCLLIHLKVSPNWSIELRVECGIDGKGVSNRLLFREDKVFRFPVAKWDRFKGRFPHMFTMHCCCTFIKVEFEKVKISKTDHSICETDKQTYGGIDL